MRNYLNSDKKLRFVSVCDGDCLSFPDGEIEDGKLFAPVTLYSESDVLVNEKPALKKDGLFEIKLELSEGENTLTAKNADETLSIKVYVYEHARGYGRISVDDNILFLWDINKNKDTYTSIFDNEYLAIYKKAHDLYGACTHLNLFYYTPAVGEGFANEREEFNLSMMTDKFKDEWIANSDWLKLNFHSYQEKPDCPYINTDYQTIYDDCKLIQDEIVRFAGEQTLSEETTVHFGEATKEGIRALRDRGIKNLAGYFTFYKDKPFVSYFYPTELVSHIEKRDLWMDTELDMLFGKIEYVLNTTKVREKLPEYLKELETNHTQNGYVDLMIHEQFFYPDYKDHIPHFEKLVLEGAKWMKQNGYKPGFLNEIRQKIEKHS